MHKQKHVSAHLTNTSRGLGSSTPRLVLAVTRSPRISPHRHLVDISCITHRADATKVAAPLARTLRCDRNANGNADKQPTWETSTCVPRVRYDQQRAMAFASTLTACLTASTLTSAAFATAPRDRPRPTRRQDLSSVGEVGSVSMQSEGTGERLRPTRGSTAAAATARYRRLWLRFGVGARHTCDSHRDGQGEIEALG